MRWATNDGQVRSRHGVPGVADRYQYPRSAESFGDRLRDGARVSVHGFVDNDRVHHRLKGIGLVAKARDLDSEEHPALAVARHRDIVPERIAANHRRRTGLAS